MASKKLGCGGFLVLMFFGGSCLALCNGFNDAQERGANDARLARAAAEKGLPFLGELRSACAAYRSAPNEIKKSEIFKRTQTLVKSQRLKDVEGILRGLSTNQGGSELALRIEVGSAEFSTESLLGPIKQGSPVYKTASEMREGQCVRFSAERLETSSVLEESQVCDPEFFARFTSLKACGTR